MLNLNRFFPYRLFYYSLRDLFDIRTHLTDSEKISLFRLGGQATTTNRVANIVEIGSYLGASSAFLAASLKESCHNSKVYCIDTWENNAMSEGSRDTSAEFMANTKKFSHWIEPVRGWSTKVVEQVKEKVDKIDLLFIDGDHSYEGCLADWQAYSPLLSEHAIVVMHDIGWAEGVQRVVEEEIRPKAIKEGRLPNMWWSWMGK